MLNMLYELTKGKTSGNYEVFINSNYCSGLGVLQDLWIKNQDLEEKEIKFYDNGHELLIYTNLGTYACNYKEYCNIKFITSVYGKEGLVLEYDFDYESQTSKCLFDLWNMRKAHPERWMYKIERIYDKYGVDIVNCVMEFAGY